MLELSVNNWVTLLMVTHFINDYDYSLLGAMAAYGSLISDNYPTRVYGVNCTGIENVLFKCPLHVTPKGASYTQCANDDAGVVCQCKILNIMFFNSLLFQYSHTNIFC